MKKRILCYGDSNTWGYIPGNGGRYDENTRWTCLVEKKLGDGYDVVEEGMTGRTTVFDTGFDDYQNGKKALGFVLKSQLPLDAAIIMLGTNDICDHHMSRIELGLGEIVRIVKNANTIFRLKTPVFPHSAKILLVSPLPFGRNCGLTEDMIEESRLFPEMTRRVASSADVSFLDPSPFITASDTDGIHLTPESHRILADLIHKSLQEMHI